MRRSLAIGLRMRPAHIIGRLSEAVVGWKNTDLYHFARIACLGLVDLHLY